MIKGAPINHYIMFKVTYFVSAQHVMSIFHYSIIQFSGDRSYRWHWESNFKTGDLSELSITLSVSLACCYNFIYIGFPLVGDQ